LWSSIALIYLSYVKQKMQEAKPFESWTLQDLLDELDNIELLEAPGYRRILGEIIEKQKSLYLYQTLGVEPPSL